MRHAIALLAGVLALSPATLSAQRAESPARSAMRGPTRVPLTIVLVQALPQPGGPSEIRRRTRGDALDVVLLPTSATAEQLSDAVRGVLTARLADGDTATRAATFRIRPSRLPSAAERGAFPWAERVLADFRHAPLRTLPGIGRAKAVVIWLPAQATIAGVRLSVPSRRARAIVADDFRM
jgi:hypothetical protein